MLDPERLLNLEVAVFAHQPVELLTEFAARMPVAVGKLATDEFLSF
jgi:hypothetical protein